MTVKLETVYPVPEVIFSEVTLDSALQDDMAYAYYKAYLMLAILKNKNIWALLLDTQ